MPPLSLHVILFSSVVNSLLLLYVCVFDACAWLPQICVVVREQPYGVGSLFHVSSGGLNYQVLLPAEPS